MSIVPPAPPTKEAAIRALKRDLASALQGARCARITARDWQRRADEIQKEIDILEGPKP